MALCVSIAEADQRFRSQQSVVCCGDRLMAGFYGKLERLKAKRPPIEARLESPGRLCGRGTSAAAVEAPSIPAGRTVADIAAHRCSCAIGESDDMDEGEALHSGVIRT